MSNVQNSGHWLHMATVHLKVVSVTEELNFQFFLILTNLYLNSHMCLVASTLYSASLFIVLG